MRINKFIASNSQISRRKADGLISEGKVFLNGKKIDKLGTKVDPEKDTVEIDHQKIKVREEKIYLALNKPQGYICSRSDEKNRPTVMELVPQHKNLKPVGRLDFATEGLLVLSNDGDFINKLTHPKFECEKEYYTVIKGKLSMEEKEKLQNGVKIDGKKTAPATIKIIKADGIQTALSITIREGRNRQIRKMFARLHHDVEYLLRTRIHTIKLGSLAKGKYRILTKKETDVN